MLEVVLLIGIGLAALGGAAAQQLARRRRLRRIMDGEEDVGEGWTDEFARRAVEVDRPWTRAGVEIPGVEVFRDEITMAEAVYEGDASNRRLVVPERVEHMVSVTAPDEGLTADLRARLHGVDPSLRELARRLAAADNFQPPGGNGFCYASPQAGNEREPAIAQGFADLVWVLVGEPEQVIESLVARARDWTGGGADDVVLMRSLPEHAQVQALAQHCARVGVPAVAVAAAAALRDPKLAQRAAFAGVVPNDLRAEALELALELSEAPGVLLATAIRTGRVRATALDQVRGCAVPEVLAALLEVAEAPLPSAEEAGIAAAFEHFLDSESARRVSEWLLSDASEVRAAAASTVRVRLLTEAEGPLLHLLGAGDEAAELAIELLGRVGTLAAVEPLLAFDADGKFQRMGVEMSIAQIQERESRGGVGGLALADETGGGELSVAVAGGELSKAEE